MKTTFAYTVVRYVHDIAIGELVNMHVALYAAEANYVAAIFNSRYGRLSKMCLGDDTPKVLIGTSGQFSPHWQGQTVEKPTVVPWSLRIQPVHVAQKDVLMVVAAAHDVIDSARILASKLARHGRSISSSSLACQGSTGGVSTV